PFVGFSTARCKSYNGWSVFFCDRSHHVQDEVVNIICAIVILQIVTDAVQQKSDPPRSVDKVPASAGIKRYFWENARCQLGKCVRVCPVLELPGCQREPEPRQLKSGLGSHLGVTQRSTTGGQHGY